jgi:hypothetical protein
MTTGGGQAARAAVDAPTPDVWAPTGDDLAAFAALTAATDAAAERLNPGGAPDWDRLERENRLRARSADAGPGVVTRWDGPARQADRHRRRASDDVARLAWQGARGADLDAAADRAAVADRDAAVVAVARYVERDRLASLALVAEPAPHVDPADLLDPADVLDVARGTGPPDDAAPRGTDPRHRPDAAARRLLRAPQAPPTSAHADAADLDAARHPAAQV